MQDGQGKLKDTYRYDEFGVLDKSTQPSDRLAVNFGYTGYPNEGNGLYFAQARYYNPEIGRFVSEDTYEGSIGNPLSLNWYVYVENNPLRYVDPSGHFKFEPYDIQELRLGLEQISEKDLSKKDEYYQVSKDFIWNHYNFKSFMDENQYNYLFGLLTGTSAYTNNAGRASWAREQLIDAYYESKEAEYVALLAMAMAGANMPGGKGTGTKSAAKKTTTKGTGEPKPKKKSIPDFVKKQWEAGNNFNKENRPRYPYNEIELEAKEVNGKKYVVDSYIPGKEIVSRKFTQLAEVQEKTALSYLSEFTKKYSAGSEISAGKFNPNALKGGRLEGELILEVPVQTKPVPQAIIDEANKKGIIIRDITGKEYN